MFLSEGPSPDKVEAFDLTPFAPDELRIGSRALYLVYALGAGQSKLTNTFIERKLGVIGTTRNWNTTNKLLDLARAIED
jgi:uncharacterized protein (DUF1697 family)